MWFLLIGAVVVLSITTFLFRWKIPEFNGKLPPGSMGFPLLGETIQFFAPNTSFDVSPFVKNRIERYGPVFKTSLVGKPLVISTDPDLNHFIFQQEGQLFQCWYPDSLRRVFGKQNITSGHGFVHKYLRNLILQLFGPESLKSMIFEVEAETTTRLRRWASLNTVELKDEISSMILDLTAKKLISYDRNSLSESLKENFDAFIQGLIAFPLDIPGTAYYKCVQGRKRTLRMLKNMLKERKANPKAQQIDFFDFVIQELEKDETILTEEIALDLIFLLLFTSFETTSTTLTFAVKFLVDHPRVLDELTAEHEGILKQRENRDSGITWREYKSMPFTVNFINETLRLANIIPAVFRKTLTDVEFNGYTIPAGWSVMMCPPATHLDPKIYADPLAFDPWRWEHNTNGASKHFLAFGGGMRFCIGADFAKLQMTVFLHYLVTKYRFEAIKGGNIVRTPGVRFPDGFHIRITEKE